MDTKTQDTNPEHTKRPRTRVVYSKRVSLSKEPFFRVLCYGNNKISKWTYSKLDTFFLKFLRVCFATARVGGAQHSGEGSPLDGVEGVGLLVSVLQHVLAPHTFEINRKKEERGLTVGSGEVHHSL